MIDLATGDSGLLREDTLYSAVIISLLTDRRAAADDVLPDAPVRNGPLPSDRRGWCGDALSEISGDRIGSRLWLLQREKQTEETRRRAIDYAREALQWMIDDGDVLRFDIDASWPQRERLDLFVTAWTPDGSSFNYAIGVVYAV